MATWHRREAAHLEPPEWYRNFHPEAWDQPDAWELGMMAGCETYRAWPDHPQWRPGWPVWLHREHARRRWGEAKYGYIQAHPEFAKQEFEEIRARRAERRQ